MHGVVDFVGTNDFPGLKKEDHIFAGPSVIEIRGSGIGVDLSGVLRACIRVEDFNPGAGGRWMNCQDQPWLSAKMVVSDVLGGRNDYEPGVTLNPGFRVPSISLVAPDRQRIEAPRETLAVKPDEVAMEVLRMVIRIGLADLMFDE